MSEQPHNPYAAPQVSVGDVHAGPHGGPVFFPVSPVKFVIMSVFTLGLYQLYWAYKNWQCEKARTGQSIMPFWRAFFGMFFCYSLLNRVRKYDESLPSANLPAAPLTIGWILLNLSGRLPDPWWVLSLGAFLMMLPVVRAIRQINDAHAPGHDTNARLSGLNWAGIVFGVFLIVLAVIGATVDEEHP